MRAAYHMAEDQHTEFSVLNTIVERLNFEDVCR
jgi:hypothetical protein